MEILNQPLDISDPELYDLIRREKSRQFCGLEMIASENFTSRSVLQCLSTCLHNKYSEGYPGRRYYGGNEHIDEIEQLCRDRALKAYGLSPDEWGVNVQPYSGSPANFAVYTAVVEPHGRIMGLDLPDGGHLTHGFYTEKKKVSATSKFFESMPYKVDPKTGLIDYDGLQKLAKLFKPKLIIAGISCYPRNLDYKRFREIADENGAYLMADMAHVSGLVAAKLVPSPFELCDIVTTTTHKTLRGPRAGIIFFRRGTCSANGQKYDLEDKINEAVFPGLQGGPHNNSIAGIATALKQTMSPEFQKYQEQVIANSKTLAKALQARNYTCVTGGTDNHIVWVDLRPSGLNGSRIEKVLEDMHIACNKNTVPGDKSALNPGGIRLGTPALTTRGLKEADIEIVAEFIHKGIQLALDVKAKSGPMLKDFKAKLAEGEFRTTIEGLKKEVQEFASKFTLPAFHFNEPDVQWVDMLILQCILSLHSKHKNHDKNLAIFMFINISTCHRHTHQVRVSNHSLNLYLIGALRVKRSKYYNQNCNWIIQQKRVIMLQLTGIFNDGSSQVSCMLVRKSQIFAKKERLPFQWY